MTSNAFSPDVIAPSLLIDAGRLAACIGPAASRLQIVAIAECASTNTLLIEGLPQQATTEALAPMRSVLLLTDRQTAGRGRRGRHWIAAPDDSLTFSLRWNFRREKNLSGLSLAVGVALRRGLLAFGAQGVVLKWPNDLLVSVAGPFAKLGGILIELSSSPGFTSAVIGVGINLRAPSLSDINQPAAGLNALTSGSWPVDRHLLVASLVNSMVDAIDLFTAEGFPPFQSDWNDADAFSGRAVVLSNDGKALDRGTCLGVDKEGALLVMTADREIRWLAGDVSLRLHDEEEK